MTACACSGPATMHPLERGVLTTGFDDTSTVETCWQPVSQAQQACRSRGTSIASEEPHSERIWCGGGNTPGRSKHENHDKRVCQRINSRIWQQDRAASWSCLACGPLGRAFLVFSSSVWQFERNQEKEYLRRTPFKPTQSRHWVEAGRRSHGLLVSVCSELCFVREFPLANNFHVSFGHVDQDLHATDSMCGQLSRSIPDFYLRCCSTKQLERDVSDPNARSENGRAAALQR